MRLALPRDEPRRYRIDIDRGILLCPEHPPAIRYHNKLPAMRDFIPDVCQTISPIDFLCAQLFRWQKVCGSPIAYPVNFDGVRRLTKISLSNAEARVLFYFHFSFFLWPLICRARIKDTCPFIPLFIGFFFWICLFCFLLYNILREYIETKYVTIHHRSAVPTIWVE